MTEEHYHLKKNGIACVGMFWRSDPKGGMLSDAPSAGWPRDGAELKGEVVDGGEEGKFLKCTQIKQKGGSWEAAPPGAFMPFRHQQYYLEKA